MEEVVGRGRAVGRRVTAAAAVVVVLILAGAVVAAAGNGGVGRPCFDACFDQCVQREEFWFCQYSCYDRCSVGARAAPEAGRGSEGDCEHSCVLSMCGQLDPEGKMMAVCRDTCRQSYAVERCRRPAAASTARAAM